MEQENGFLFVTCQKCRFSSRHSFALFCVGLLVIRRSNGEIQIAAWHPWFGSTEHQKEVSFLKSIIRKAKKWFPLFQELVYMERFCLKVGFSERQTVTLFLFGGTQTEVHDREGELPSGESPGGQIEPCTCHQRATDRRMVKGTVQQVEEKYAIVCLTVAKKGE